MGKCWMNDVVSQWVHDFMGLICLLQNLSLILTGMTGSYFNLETVQ